MVDNVLFQGLFAVAAQVRLNSHSPISDFKVGAALITEGGNIYGGTNAEDPAFNHSVHAEQGAIAQMVAQEGRQRITHLVVVGGKEGDGTICTPCGHCRQLLVEFADDDMEVAVAGPGGDIRLTTSLGKLLPHAFRLSNFKP
jgi:cytidine deaminase